MRRTSTLSAAQLHTLIPPSLNQVSDSSGLVRLHQKVQVVWTLHKPQSPKDCGGSKTQNHTESQKSHFQTSLPSIRCLFAYQLHWSVKRASSNFRVVCRATHWSSTRCLCASRYNRIIYI